MLIATLLQAATTAVQSMPNAGDTTEVVPYLTSAGLVVYAQKWMKTRPLYTTLVEQFPGANKWAHRLVAALGATIAALGIHVSFAGDYQSGWTFHGSIPDLWTMVHAGSDWVKVYVLQAIVYDATKQPPYSPVANR